MAGEQSTAQITCLCGSGFAVTTDVLADAAAQVQAMLDAHLPACVGPGAVTKDTLAMIATVAEASAADVTAERAAATRETILALVSDGMKGALDPDLMGLVKADLRKRAGAE